MLIKTLCKEKILALLFPKDSEDHSKTIKVIANFISAYLAGIIQTSNCAVVDSPIILHGAVADGERTRRYYYTSSSSSSQELKWVELDAKTQSSGVLAGKVFDELFHLLKSIVSQPFPDAANTFLTHYILSHLKLQNCEEKDCLKYANPKKPLLNLIYCNQNQLTLLLREMSQKLRKMRSNLSKQFSDIMNLLKENCEDYGCWKCPLIDILSGGLHNRGVVYSHILLDLMNRFDSRKPVSLEAEGTETEEVEEKSSTEMFEFVSEGESLLKIKKKCMGISLEAILHYLWK